MWKFSGEVKSICTICGYIKTTQIEDFTEECIDVSERQMGKESIYELKHQFDCSQCGNPISLCFQVSEYPIESLNIVINNSQGATTSGEPVFEYLREIYSARDLFDFYRAIEELIFALKTSPELMRELSSTEFDDVVSEIFRAKGFNVALTKRTRDGGKDIIAIHTDALGISNKYFIECKRYSEDNKVGVELVRALHGVKNTKDGPNKVILVTTSTFTSEAKKFAEHEAHSKWDITLADYYTLIDWLDGYKEGYSAL